MTTVLTTYLRHHADANDLVRSIADDLGDKYASPDRATWAHVGDMVRIETMLRDVLDVMRGNKR